MNKNNLIILKQLKQSNKALTAYEILDEVRPLGIKSPPQVYRSLTSLIDDGKVHKVESLNAFMVCSHSHTDQNVIFLICDNCQNVSEMDANCLSGTLSDCTKDKGFSAREVMIEVKGICATCQTVIPSENLTD